MTEQERKTENDRDACKYLIFNLQLLGVFIVNYLRGAREKFVKSSVHMNTRDQFEDYMRVLENRFYESVKLPKSPYVDASRREGDNLPIYEPHDYGNSLEGTGNAMRGTRQAEINIDKLLELDRKRRGINTSDKAKRNTSSLNLTGRSLGQYASPNYDRLNQVTPFYDTFMDQQGLLTTNPAASRNDQQQLIVGSGGQNPMRSSSSKFVAGSFRPEKSDLDVPSNDYMSRGQPNAPLSAQEPYICDVTTMDAQYERYKNVMKSKFYNLKANSTTHMNVTALKYGSQPASFSGYGRVIADQRQEMLDQLKDPLSAGPDLFKSNIREDPEPIEKPKLVQIYQMQQEPQLPPPKLEAGYAALTLNNTVTKEVLESLGGLRDTIKPIANSLTTHEMRPYELYNDYRQTLQQVRAEDEQSLKASISCLRGDLDSPPKPLYAREGDDEMTNGARFKDSMIGKARLVSASPFRATLKVGRLTTRDGG